MWCLFDPLVVIFKIKIFSMTYEAIHEPVATDNWNPSIAIVP